MIGFLDIDGFVLRGIIKVKTDDNLYHNNSMSIRRLEFVEFNKTGSKPKRIFLSNTKN
jgi:hypothetical protein